MKSHYLNDTNRSYYSDALELIRNCKDEFWNLDPKLGEYIDRINENWNIRTMYSRNGGIKMDSALGSYLTICYSENLEEKILTYVIPNMISRFSEIEDCEFDYSREEPRQQEPYEGVNPYLKYIDHSEYWNVYHIKFELKSYFYKHHDTFWKELTEELIKV